jgi:divalent metal cation (Fe/Co/Zn/Cd) transporter
VLTGLGFAWGDSVAAIAVAVMISILGLRLGRSTIETLLDRAPEGAAEKAIAAIRAVPGVVGVERLRVRMVGPTHFIDAIAKVPRTYPIDRVEASRRPRKERSPRRSATPTSPSPRCRSRATMRACASASW